ncbi:MAG: HDIG domain-containing protein [Firmicutes bacterium]|nr:HDIG domain-containing protein [Bacillota bacterium]
MDRETALKTVKEHVKQTNLIKHMLATEAIMRRLAVHFQADEEMWGLSGLVHDIDYDQTADEPERHAIVGAEILKSLGVNDAVVQAVLGHADKGPRLTLMDKALYATDPLTGLLVAAALVHPDKKLASLDVDFVKNRFAEKSFARGADRDVIKSCSEVGLELDQFIALGLEAMQGIAKELGL